MKSLKNTLAALPVRELGRRADLMLAIVMAFVVSMLIIPLPGFALDALIAVNICGGVLIFMVALFARRILEVSTFPSILLMTTLFRLGLNVSTTRGILSRGDAGSVVKAFGVFVLQGDVVVGMVIFLVITLVQFLVIAKGSERVAEVSARFTLDAMPGKQMSIDAALRNGAITEEEAEIKRDELGRESQLFGNMDGAMKFVKGDAIAGLIITGINLIAGFIIGVARGGLELSEALSVYSILTVGDGLVSQISALLITLAAGVLVTRVQDPDKSASLGFTMQREMFGDSKVLGVASGLMAALALVPGLPMLPFLLLSLVTAAAAAGAAFYRPDGDAAPSDFESQLNKKIEQAKAQRGLADQLAPSVVPIAIELDPHLSRTLGFDDGTAEETELVGQYLRQARDALFVETGVRFPAARVRTHVRSLPRDTVVIRIKDVPVLRQVIPSDFVAMAEPKQLLRLGIRAEALPNPVGGGAVARVTASQREVVQAAGVTVWDPAGLVALHLVASLRARTKDFVGLHEVTTMVERMEQAYPGLVRELVPKAIGVPLLTDVLRRLVDEQVCIRDLKTIFEALGEHAPFELDPVHLTERVRASLAHQLAHSYAPESRLQVVLLDPMIEETIEDAMQESPRGTYLALEPQVARQIIGVVAKTLRPVVQQGVRPVIITRSGVRRFVRRLLETDIPRVAVLSYDELPGHLDVQPMGRASLQSAPELAA